MDKKVFGAALGAANDYTDKHGGEPEEYLKSAYINDDGNLILVKKDGTEIEFEGGGSGGGIWGSITGNIDDQEDLMNELNKKVPMKSLTISAISSLENIPTGVGIKVYLVFNGQDYLYTQQTYGTTPIVCYVPMGALVKVTGVNYYPYVNPETKTIAIVDDSTTTITFTEVGGKSTVADIHALIEFDLQQQTLEIGDEINMAWTASNGTEYNLKPKVAGFFNVINHATGESVPAVAMQIYNGLPDAPQFDAAEVEEATEETARAGIYYYGLSGSTYTLLTLSEGDPIPYDDYDHIYFNSFRDTSFNILKYGNNLLEYSAEHQFLNSAEARGNWWHSTHEGDTAPSQANSIDGFMHGLDASDLQYILDHDFKICENTITGSGELKTLHGKFRNPTVVEMYGSPDKAGEGVGTYLPFWEQVCKNTSENPLNAPGNGNCGARRIKNLEDGNTSTVFLASCVRGNSGGVWYAYNSNGNLNNYCDAYNSYRCAPLFFIF